MESGLFGQTATVFLFLRVCGLGKEEEGGWAGELEFIVLISLLLEENAE